MKSGFLAVGVAVAGLLSVHARELKIEKLGTTCVGGVEANPLVYRGRLYHFESFRDSSKGRVWGPNRCGRFRDLEGDLNEPLAPAPKGLYFACAFVEGEKVVVTGVKSPGANHVLQCESTDLVHWTEPRVILSNATWRCYNTSICRVGGRYVMVYERGGSDPEVGSQFTMFFAESTDLRTWRTIPGAVFGREFYTGSPCLRYFGGYYYFLYLNNRFRMRIVRSKDLRNWETSPRVVLDFDENDHRLYPGIAFTDEEKERIRTSEDINASDFDMCEWKGDLVISYSWGNQRGKEFLALAKVRNATEREFCESFFDGPVSLGAGVSLPAGARPESASDGRWHFLRRLAAHRKRLLKMGVNCAPLK